MKWTQAEAVNLCRELEAIAPQFGGHVALTGGTLYKAGPRKDLDILIYRIRQADGFDWDGFFAAISDTLGITRGKTYGWCMKAVTMDGGAIDFFDPHYIDPPDSAVIHGSGLL